MAVSQQSQVSAAFDATVGRLEKAARLYMRRHRMPPEDAEDILQETLLVFLLKHENIYNPEAWLRGTLRKRCQFYWRRRQKTLLRVVDTGVLDALSARPSMDLAEHDDVKVHLGRAMDSIPPRCQKLLRLRYGQDCDPQAAAAQLGYRPSGAYKIFERCLAALTRGLVATGFVKESPCE